MFHSSKKILTLSQALQFRLQWQLLGEKVVFTNGCFDILHLGHVSYLEAARKLGKHLIIGLNADISVQKLKGESRPLFPEDARARVLAALEYVDVVIIFEETTADNLLSTLKPDIYAKGGDYEPETLPEYASVKQYGGEIVILPFVAGYSSTAAIAKMKG